jgi:hypothetical protein
MMVNGELAKRHTERHSQVPVLVIAEPEFIIICGNHA